MRHQNKRSDDEDETGAQLARERAARELEGFRFELARCDDTLERDFAHELAKHLARGVRGTQKEQIASPWGPLCVDFLLLNEDGRRLAVQLDEARSDHLGIVQDAALLGTGALSAIIRFDRSALEERLFDCLFMLSSWEERFFSERAKDNLRASPELARAFAEHRCTRFACEYEHAHPDDADAPEEERAKTRVVFVRRSASAPGHRQPWEDCFEVLSQSQTVNLSDALDAYAMHLLRRA